MSSVSIENTQQNTTKYIGITNENGDDTEQTGDNTDNQLRDDDEIQFTRIKRVRATAVRVHFQYAVHSHVFRQRVLLEQCCCMYGLYVYTSSELQQQSLPSKIENHVLGLMKRPQTMNDDFKLIKHQG